MLMVILIFVAVFAVAAPILVWSSGAHNAGKKEKVAEVLDNALGKASGDEKHDPLSFRKADNSSNIPLLDRFLQQLDLIPRIAMLLRQADLKWTPGALVLMCAVAFAVPAYIVNFKTGILLIALGVGVATGLLPLAFVWFKRVQRFGKFEGQLPEALDLICSALRAGHSLSAALGLVTRECQDPLAGEFRLAFDEQNFGLDMRTALENLVKRVPLQDLKMAITAIIIQRESGGNLAEVLEKTAHMVRERFRLKKQVKVHTAQGRLTGLVLTILPVALGFGLWVINPDNESMLWHRPIGIKLLIGAGVSLVIGSAIIQKIVRLKV
ncbi:type II secretion system F family protein [Occallatibacter riparius]|uniref:Type II secretion system F family protein n=1 Tax=Occallatibacter riparius TaxID=1002689 RepID=A0A9J7BKF9_9BACT|nr:type II secretion system F family protein [Occallatibacter riparius]UWZ83075.1 type II secretion system F family protein [Occallatibacter riparius]